MRARRAAAWTAALLSIALVTTACGGGGGGQPDGGAAAPSGVTISVNGTEPENPLVPGNTNETGGGKIIDALFSSLVEYDPVTAQPANMVAESIETTDSRVYTIRLKDGWTFHDGSPVTAQSFVRAWNHVAYSPNGQQNGSFFSKIQGYDQVHTADPDGAAGPQTAPEPAAREMSGLRVIDDRTFEVTLSTPFAVFPTMLGYRAFAPLPDVFFTDQAAFEARPIGNGPFRFVSRQPGVNVIVERYEQWPGTPKPSVGGVEFRFYESAEAAYADVVANNLDFLEVIPPSGLAGNLYQTDLANRSVSRTFLGVQRLAFPLYDARYQNPQLRQALSMAIDREQINQQIFGGTRPAADGLVAPDVPGRIPNQCGELCTYQPDRARQMFQASGFQGPIELTSNADSGNAEWIQAACVSISNALGVQCNFVPVPTFGEHRSAVNARQLTRLFRTSWVADYPSIENFLNPLYRTGGSTNDGEYSNPAVDDVLARADAAPSIDEGNALYQEAERMIIQDMPAIPVYFQSFQAGWSERMQNVTVTPLRELDLESVTVTE
jgi:oligopeptide transport system substrate-binding protein